jgi:formate hydrogenlyase subunit 3/multisubunit Na+/H+ antiporter MnhD subunit
MVKIKLIIFLPIVTLLLVIGLNKFPVLATKFSGKISVLFAGLFTFFCFGLNGFAPQTLNLLSIAPNLDLVWSLKESHRLFLLLVGCFWFFVEIYVGEFFLKNNDKKIEQFRVLFLITIVALIFLVLSQSLLSALLFYQILSIILCFFVANFIPKNSQKSAKNFSFFIFLSAMFLSLAAALTYKITGNLNFIENGVISTKINLWQYSLLFCFYAFSCCLIAFVPAYLLFGNLYYLNPPVIIAIFPSFALGTLLLIFKVIFYIFGQDIFWSFIKNIDYHHLLTLILSFNLLGCGLLAIFSKNLKQILIFLFFNQLIFIIIEFLNFGLSAKHIQISIISFVLSQILIFLAVGNISLYLKNSGDKTLNGIIYQLRITVWVLAFALLNLVGLAPSVGLLEKFWLVKAVFHDRSLGNGLIMIVNFVLCLFCIVKVFYPMIEISARSQNKEKSEIAKDIELNLALISPILIIPLILIFLFIMNFFNL